MSTGSQLRLSYTLHESIVRIVTVMRGELLGHLSINPRRVKNAHSLYYYAVMGTNFLF